MHQSICLLSNRFDLNEGVSLDKLRYELTKCPQSNKPYQLVDKNRYLKYIWENGGIQNISAENIFQLEVRTLQSKVNSSVFDFSNKEVFLDEKKEIELVANNITFLFILDHEANFGLLFFVLELKFYAENPLAKLSELKTFRYFINPGGKAKENLFVYENNNHGVSFTLIDLFLGLMPQVAELIVFLNPKPIQLHFFDKPCYYLQDFRESHCYNILRIPSTKSREIENKYFETNSNHIFENSSVFGFTLGEGVILMSPYKSPKQLFSNFFAAQLLTLIQKERASSLRNLSNRNLFTEVPGLMTKNSLIELKKFRKLISITKFYNSIPISQYSEIQEMFSQFKRNFFSESEFEDLNVALGEITNILQEEAERASNEREKNMGTILGIFSITGFISFLFDYFFVSSNEKLLDYLGFPFNLIPFVLFLISFYIFWKLFNKT